MLNPGTTLTNSYSIVQAWTGVKDKVFKHKQPISKIWLRLTKSSAALKISELDYRGELSNMQRKANRSLRKLETLEQLMEPFLIANLMKQGTF